VRGLLWIPALIVAAVVAAALDGDSGLRTWWELRGDVAKLHARNAGLRAEVASLRGQAEALASEPFALERAIREDLGLVQPGETLVRLPRDDDRSSRIP
jgi:cell division protein FtsB